MIDTQSLEAVESGQQQAPSVVDLCTCISLMSTIHIEDFQLRKRADVSRTSVADRVAI